jgi:hypothetical protein
MGGSYHDSRGKPGLPASPSSWPWRTCVSKPSKRLHAAAARFYADAFAAEPRLADDLRFQHRYNAACAAALASCGQGKDTAKLEDKERTRLRRQAVDWLRADLTRGAMRLESGQPADRAEVQKSLRHWQGDPDLAGLRDQPAVARLPAEEQKACRKLWPEVEALLAKAREMK